MSFIHLPSKLNDGTACENVFVSFHQGRNYVRIITVIKYLSGDNICSAISSCDGRDPSLIITMHLLRLPGLSHPSSYKAPIRAALYRGINESLLN